MNQTLAVFDRLKLKCNSYVKQHISRPIWSSFNLLTLEENFFTNKFTATDFVIEIRFEVICYKLSPQSMQNINLSRFIFPAKNFHSQTTIFLLFLYFNIILMVKIAVIIQDKKLFFTKLTSPTVLDKVLMDGRKKWPRCWKWQLCGASSRPNWSSYSDNSKPPDPPPQWHLHHWNIITLWNFVFK